MAMCRAGPSRSRRISSARGHTPLSRLASPSGSATPSPPGAGCRRPARPRPMFHARIGRQSSGIASVCERRSGWLGRMTALVSFMDLTLRSRRREPIGIGSSACPCAVDPGRGDDVSVVPFPRAADPNRTCVSPRIRLSTCPALWSPGTGCRVDGPRSRDACSAVPMAFDHDAGCAEERDLVVGEPPPLVTESLQPAAGDAVFPGGAGSRHGATRSGRPRRTAVGHVMRRHQADIQGVVGSEQNRATTNGAAGGVTSSPSPRRCSS